ncbi:MAG: VIT1/CCC1 transporter family protein [Bacteroidota bacterium]
MGDVAEEKRARVLDPIERVSEVIFGLLMAMTFVGSLSVATAGREEVRTMMITALGCNLAWGLADAVMYLVRTVTERTRKRMLLARLRGGADAATGQALVADALPPRLADAAGPGGLELLRRRLAGLPALPAGPRLGVDDFKGALGVFLLVVFATFPVVVPFMLFDQAALAVRVSNLVALVMLFIAGWVLARYAGGSPWRGGTAMAATGAVLMAAIMALGG